MTLTTAEAVLLRKALTPLCRKHGPKVTQVSKWSGISIATLYRIWEWNPEDGPWRDGTRADNAGLIQRRKIVVQLAKEVATTPTGKKFPIYPSAPAIKKKLATMGRGNVHRSTIHRDLQASGMKCVVRRYIPTRDLSKKRAFAAAMLKNPALCRRLIFSDEHTISVNDHSCRIQYVQEGVRPIGRERKRLHNVVNLSVWGAIGKDWRSPLSFLDKDPAPKRPRGRPRKVDVPEAERGAKKQHKVKPPPKRCDGEMYVRRCLTPTLCAQLKAGGRVLMQDGAKFHWSKHVQAYLAQHGVEVLQNGLWPAHSPDLNPIENLWALLNRKISDLHPTDLQDLKAKAAQAWGDIPVAVMNRYHASFGAKCKAVVDGSEVQV